MRLIVMLLIAVMSTSTVYAVDINVTDVPEAVQKAFDAKFPKAKDVEWEQEEDGTYEAEFKLKGAEHEAVFKEDGTWVYTAKEMKLSEYVGLKREMIEKTNEGYTITEVKTVEHAEHGDCYLIELENENGDEREILTLKTGGVISTKDEKNNEDEEEDDHEGHDHTH